MDALILMKQAAAAGLTLTADGDRLNVTGPNTPASADLVKALAMHKAAVLPWLAIETAIEIAPDITVKVIRNYDPLANSGRPALPRHLWRSDIANYSEAWHAWQTLRQDYFAVMGHHVTGYYINDSTTEGYLE